MKKSIFFLILLFFLSIAAFGQMTELLTGRVSDADGQPLPYVNIGILGTAIGTVSGPDGSFALYLDESVSEKDTLRFSMVGHESRSYTVGGFFKNQKTGGVSLPAAVTQLGEVVVRPDFARKKKIGMERPSTRMVTNWAITDKPNQNLGAEIGRKFNLPKDGAQLDSFQFYLAHNSFDTVRLRVNIYEMEKGKPGKNITPGSIIIELTARQKGWVNVDLTTYRLFVEKNVVVSVEWVYHSVRGKSLSIPLAMPSPGVHFYKYGSQNLWKKFAGMSAAMGLWIGY